MTAAVVGLLGWINSRLARTPEGKQSERANVFDILLWLLTN